MTYPKKLSQLGLLVLTESGTLSKLSTLAPGSAFTCEGSPASIDKLRYYLYIHLYHQGLRTEYSLRRETPTSLRIVRRPTFSVRISSVETLTPSQEFVKATLLDVTSLDEAITKIDKAIDVGLVLSEDIPDILEEWKRVQGASLDQLVLSEDTKEEPTP